VAYAVRRVIADILTEMTAQARMACTRRVRIAVQMRPQHITYPQLRDTEVEDAGADLTNVALDADGLPDLGAVESLRGVGLTVFTIVVQAPDFDLARTPAALARRPGGGRCARTARSGT
jgi:hypothetical protein